MVKRAISQLQNNKQSLIFFDLFAKIKINNVTTKQQSKIISQNTSVDDIGGSSLSALH